LNYGIVWVPSTKILKKTLLVNSFLYFINIVRGKVGSVLKFGKSLLLLKNIYFMKEEKT